MNGKIGGGGDGGLRWCLWLFRQWGFTIRHDVWREKPREKGGLRGMTG